MDPSFEQLVDRPLRITYVFEVADDQAGEKDWCSKNRELAEMGIYIPSVIFSKTS
jgi:hypothetical protein